VKSFRLHRGPRQHPDPVEEATQLIGLIGTFAVFTFIIGFAVATGIVSAKTRKRKAETITR
jgi:hypothetical protein